ncbi:hypothetical protein EYF80_016272 [Liparis tanakae]|uniref:Uncharacterized protein n=1 Tax=Liparis tanakae TaxID=230148 RepID=A0A4Z2I833_9TELE|nr:hypothetical protein EYF80_016272 [Liparis tanakae]
MVATFEEEIKKLTKDLNEKDHMLEYSKQVLDTHNEAVAEHLKMELGQNNQLEATLKTAWADMESLAEMYHSQKKELQLQHNKFKEMEELSCLNWRFEFQRLTDTNIVLEDIRLKNVLKSRGIFGKRWPTEGPSSRR